MISRSLCNVGMRDSAGGIIEDFSVCDDSGGSMGAMHTMIKRTSIIYGS
jgi:hypothetical protein